MKTKIKLYLLTLAFCILCGNAFCIESFFIENDSNQDVRITLTPFQNPPDALKSYWIGDYNDRNFYGKGEELTFPIDAHGWTTIQVGNSDHDYPYQPDFLPYHMEISFDTVYLLADKVDLEVCSTKAPVLWLDQNSEVTAGMFYGDQFYSHERAPSIWRIRDMVNDDGRPSLHISNNLCYNELRWTMGYLSATIYPEKNTHSMVIKDLNFQSCW